MENYTLPAKFHRYESRESFNSKSSVCRVCYKKSKVHHYCVVDMSTNPETATHQSGSPPPRSSTTYDPTWYTWSRFFRMLTNSASNLEIQQYVQADSITRETEICRRCENWRQWLFEYSPVIRFMREHTQKLGADLNEHNVVCRRCATLTEGGASLKKAAFHKDFGILLCANHLPNKGEQEDAMAHEMVHAYDYLRFKYDENNLRHAACTEVSCTRNLFSYGNRSY